MPVTLPFDLATPAQRDILAAELMANYQALVDKFSAGIVDADISTGANISGSKLALNSIPADRVVNASLTQTQMANNSIGTAQLIDSNVTTPKYAPASIGKDKLKVTEVTQVFSGLSYPAAGLGEGLVSLTPSPALPLMSAMFPIFVSLEALSVSVSTLTGANVGLWVNGTTVTYAICARVASGAAFTLSGTVRFRYLALT